MRSINQVQLMGNLTRDPELKYTQNNTALAKVGIAVNRSYKDKNDEWQDHVEFFNVTFWGKTAERVAQFKTGDRMLVNGRLGVNSWEDDKTGAKRSQIEITGTDFAGFPKQTDSDNIDPDEEQSTQDAQSDDVDPNDIPF